MLTFPLFKLLHILTCAAIVNELAHPIECVSSEKDLIITASEKQTLDKFKENVEAHLPHDYMKEEIFLIRFLRARNFNLEAAENMLKSNLEWRKKNKMDTINDEDWTEMQERYKYYVHSIDKKGQPVVYFALGSWDFRKAVISGENEKLNRYLESAIQSACRKPREFRANQNSTVTQIDLIVDLGGFSLTQQGCLVCVSFYIRFVSNYENYFPGCAERIILLNVPAAFDFIIAAVRPIFSQQTKEALEIYGTNRNQWQKALNSFIDKSQIPPELGGSDYIGYES